MIIQKFTDNDERIIKIVKLIVKKYDEFAEVIFYGSRARGDFHEESDYDFLILSDLPESSGLIKNVRKDVLEQIEFKTFETVSTTWRNRKNWKDNYAVTNFYASISEEGIIV